MSLVYDNPQLLNGHMKAPCKLTYIRISGYKRFRRQPTGYSIVMSLTVTQLCVVPREFSVVTVLSQPKRLIPFFRKCSLAVALLFEKMLLWKKLLYPECLFAVDLFLQMFIGWYTFLLISGLSKGLNLVSFASILGSVAQYMESLLCKFQCDRPYFDGSNSTVHEVSL